uniref:Uncharacterized protein n=1 Tax=Amblyomma aureolatum TaxID=187763 RepID=A0A1E1XCY9_9ACAR
MFRVVEGQQGVTHIYRSSTSELVCTVKEKCSSRAFKTSSLLAPSRFRNPRRCALGANNCKSPELSKERFLSLLELQPTNGVCAPRAVVERLPADCDDGGEWTGAQAAVANYGKYCSSRGRLLLPSVPYLYPVVYRAARHHMYMYLGHRYSFNKRERWKRMRELRTGLGPRALHLLDRCKDLRVKLRRLTPSEVALWTKGHTRLGRTPLRELPSFQRPVRCVLPNVKTVAKMAMCNCVVRELRTRGGTLVVPPSSPPLF